MPKYLIIRFSSIGDIVLTSPIIRSLRNQKPDCEIHYITKRSFSDILQNNPYIDRVISIENEIDEVISELKDENYDFIIDLHNNLRSLRLKKKLSRPSAAFPKLNFKKFLYTNFKWNYMPDFHIVERYFEAVKPLGISKDDRGLDYFIPEKDEVNLEDIGINTPFIAFSIGAQFATKKLPNDKIIELINKINFSVVLLGGESDIENSKQIESQVSNVINLCGQLNLNQSASILNQSKSVITHDTGLMHIAAAFNKKIISIWGNTTPDLGMYPYMPGHENLYSIHEVELKCRPCSKIGFDKCPKSHFNCMKLQNLNEIAQIL